MCAIGGGREILISHGFKHRAHDKLPKVQMAAPKLTRLETWSNSVNMTTININEAKTHLSRYAKRVKAGETIILCDRNVPFAELRPLPLKKKSGKRRLGQLKGQCPVDKEFFESDKEVEKLFSTPLTGGRKSK